MLHVDSPEDNLDKSSTMVTDSAANSYGAIEFVGDFDNFQLEIFVERGGAEKFAKLRLRGGRLLASDEGVEPCEDKKDFALALDLRKGLEGGFQVRESQFGLVPVVEGAQA